MKRQAYDRKYARSWRLCQQVSIMSLLFETYIHEQDRGREREREENSCKIKMKHMSFNELVRRWLETTE